MLIQKLCVIHTDKETEVTQFLLKLSSIKHYSMQIFHCNNQYMTY